jgi:hypothetical protein
LGDRGLGVWAVTARRVAGRAMGVWEECADVRSFAAPESFVAPGSFVEPGSFVAPGSFVEDASEVRRLVSDGEPDSR